MERKLPIVKSEIVSRLREAGALGIIRVQTAQDLVQIAKALHAGGLSCLEITMTTPGALRAIEEARGELPDVLMGAGTVLDAPTARQAILAGAQFLATPHGRAGCDRDRPSLRGPRDPWGDDLN